MKTYTFRKMKQEEVPEMFRLILRRVCWMDEVGIRQWNVTDYANVYPLSYYEEKCHRGETYALVDDDTGELICAAVLKEEDDRWPDTANGFYVHNFASQLGMPGIGAQFLERAEEYARSVGKDVMRLDSAIDNAVLTKYYEALGYQPMGQCRDGAYTGILREKKL